MCSVIKSGISNDPLKDSYSEVDKRSNIYTTQLGLGGAYSKKFEHIRIDNMV